MTRFIRTLAKSPIRDTLVFHAAAAAIGAMLFAVGGWYHASAVSLLHGVSVDLGTSTLRCLALGGLAGAILAAFARFVDEGFADEGEVPPRIEEPASASAAPHRLGLEGSRSWSLRERAEPSRN